MRFRRGEPLDWSALRMLKAARRTMERPSGALSFRVLQRSFVENDVERPAAILW